MNNFPSAAEVLRLREKYAPGTRIELTAPIQNPYIKLNAGERATVRGVDGAGNILCRWDSGSSLNLIPGINHFKIVSVLTPEIKSQILEIRAEGQTNMFNTVTVQRLAYEKDFYALVNFIEEDKAGYVMFILHGE